MKEKNYIRICQADSNEEFTWIGPFDTYGEAFLFGQKATNPQFESYEVFDQDDLPKGIEVTAPSSVDIQH